MKYKLGAAICALLGFILVLSPYVASSMLSTIIYPTEFWYDQYPNGPTDNPTMLSPNQETQLMCQLVYFDYQTKTTLPGTYVTWTVKVTIDEASETLTFPRGEVVSSVETRYSTFVFKTNWYVPADEGQEYTFNWEVILRDNDGVEYSRKTTTTYAKTIAEEPDGYFSVDGEKANELSTHVVLDSPIKVQFTPTKDASKLTSVYVELWEDTSKKFVKDLTAAGAIYEADVDLPDFGSYELKGFYTWSGSSNPLQKMSLMLDMSGDNYKELDLGGLQIAGLLCFIPCGLLLAKDRELW